MDDNVLNADERAFFETGNLPPTLQPTIPEQAPTAEPPTQQQSAAPQQQSPTLPQPDYMQQSLQAANARYATLEQQIQQLTTQLATVNAPVEPDPQLDPIGAITSKLNKLHDELNNIKQTSLQSSQQQAYNAFHENIRNLRDEFAKTTPDFKSAYEHLRSIRAEDFRVLGVPELDINAYLNNEEIQLAQQALQQGRNPAQLIYDLAKRHGYATKTPVSTPAPVAPEDKLAQLKAGAVAAQTVPRAATTDNMTLETLRDASNADLDNVVLNEEQWHKLVGGRPMGKSIF